VSASNGKICVLSVYGLHFINIYFVQGLLIYPVHKFSSLNEDQLKHLTKEESETGYKPKISLDIATELIEQYLSEICVPVSMISACKWKDPCCSCCRLAALLSPLRLPAVTKLSGTLCPAVLLTGLSVTAAGCKIL
jgi:hypothetical protein